MRKNAEPRKRIGSRIRTDRTCRDRWATDAVKPVTARDDVAFESSQLAGMTILDRRCVRLDVVQRNTLDVEQQRLSVGDRRGDQVLDDLVLPVDGDRSTARQLRHVDSMIAAVEAKRDTFVNEPLAAQPFADADVLEQVGGVVLQHARSRALLAVRAALRFQDHGLDAPERQHAREDEPRRSGADDSHLGSEHALL